MSPRLTNERLGEMIGSPAALMFRNVNEDEVYDMALDLQDTRRAARELLTELARLDAEDCMIEDAWKHTEALAVLVGWVAKAP